MDREAARYLPDYIHTSETQGDLKFTVTPIGEMFDDMMEPDCVGLRMKIPGVEDDKEYFYLTTDWSRHQLLQLVGAKEKWFDSVSLDRQAEELNARLHVLDNCMFRTMKVDNALPVRVIRGLVSSRYSDFPNTDIMKDLVEVCPAEETYCIRSYSGITEKCFYAAVVIDEPMGIPGSSEGYPGVIVKNSEVGFTSLWVVPFLYLPQLDRMAVFEKKTYLRRIHRGTFESVGESFRKAMGDASTLWKTLQPKTAKLRTITFATEDEAIESMRNVLTRLRTTKGFQLACQQAYQRQKHTHHDATKIFEAVCMSATTITNQDAAYDASAIAGALLLSLTENL